MGRAWQLSQLVEGVLTAFNPSHGSLFRRGRRARRARFPTCGVIRVAGYSVVWDYDPTPISPKEHQKERCGHYSAAALLHYFSWCASRYSVAGRIFCYVLHDNVRTNVCQWPFAENFHLLIPLLNQIDSISNLYIFTISLLNISAIYLYFIALDFPT